MSTPKDMIITLPDLRLRQRSKKITFSSEKTLALIQAMEEATLDWEDNRDHEVGVALAAVQIGELERVVVVRNNFDDKNDRTFSVFINPEIVKLEGDIIEDYEGCLSIKDIYGRVKRYSKVRVKAYDINGKELRFKAEGFLARVFQHEIDHTNGITFIDHIKDSSDAFYSLGENGELTKIDYEKNIRNSRILW